MTRRDFTNSLAAGAALTAGGAHAASQTAPKLRIRKAGERGQADHGWLRTAHSFSFANYQDPENLHFEALRVINDDWIAGGGGFPAHPHRDFEIFSYVLDGALSHEDSMGNGSTVGAGGVQYMSAGSGVVHSEFNASQTEPAALLQIWLIPNVLGAQPRYETKDVAPQEKDGRFAPILSGTGLTGAIPIRADADVFAATLRAGQTIERAIPEGRRGWLQVARGGLTLNGLTLRQGDGVAIESAGPLTLTDGRDAEVLLFELDPLPI